MDRPNLQVLKSFPLWIEFEKKTTNHADIAKVESLIIFADEILERIIETFPTYTLHNGIHQLNVVRIIGDLLGESINSLTSLECSILLLSSYFHDIGMVFSENERNNLKEEEDFNLFLNEKPDAYLEYYKSKEVTKDIAEWYCRWSHAKRVHKFIKEIEFGILEWNGISLKNILGDICESHNWNIETLKEDSKFDINFLTEADLRFCAVLLRLGDILDFDRSRSPINVYNYLGLKKRETKRKEISDVEWLKHLSSKGFRFPVNDQRELTFIAGPDNPAVEHDVREFLDIIDQELNKCRTVIKYCSNKWKNFSLPEKINRDNIISQGYKYGEFKFTLDHEKILNLLMGENLYENKNVFVRELLQNAIDTSKHRIFHEKSTKNLNHLQKSIEWTNWTDEDGYNWIRIDDFGIGMDEYKILNFLLKVGNSYYNSVQFKIDKLKYYDNFQKDFTPISRFGIGILSCFMICDKIEISTRHVINNESIRLSISGLYNYYILQSGKDIPFNMPNQLNIIEHYRKEYGTAIAVRINPEKEDGSLNLASTLLQMIFDSPIEIRYKFKDINKKTNLLVKKPKIKRFIYNLNKKQQTDINNFIEHDVGKLIKIEFIPLNITKNSTSSLLTGQLILIRPIVDTNDNKILKLLKDFSISVWYDRLAIKKEREDGKILDDSNQNELDIDISEISQNKRKYLSTIQDHSSVQQSFYFRYYVNLVLAHNGITVPTKLDLEQYASSYLNIDSNEFEVPFQGRFRSFMVIGAISMQDKLRPNLSTARNILKPLPLNVYSNIILSFLRAYSSMQILDIKIKSFDLFGQHINLEDLKLKNLINENTFIDNDKWPNERIIKTNLGYLSINEICNFVIQKKNIEIYLSFVDKYRHKLFTLNLLKFLIQYFLKGEIDTKYKSLSVKGVNKKPVLEGLKLFPPLLFVSYPQNKFFKHSNFPLNINHPISQWLIEKSQELNVNYSGLMKLLVKDLENLALNNIDKSTKRTYQQINKILDRLSLINNNHLNVPHSMRLKSNDFKK